MQPAIDAIFEFKQICLDNWGAYSRTTFEQFNNLPRIQDLIDFDQASDEVKAHIAHKIILESLSRRGVIFGANDIEWFLCNFARDLRSDHEILSGRRFVPIKTALMLSAKSPVVGDLAPQPDDNSLIIAGGTAVAAVYLLSQLEYVFRMASRYLDGEGKVVISAPPQLLGRMPNATLGRRVDRIEQAFELFLYRTATNAARILRDLEKQISVGLRLAATRNPAMHGFLGDTSTEGRFYGLILAIFYYSERSESAGIENPDAP